ncbi:hypothetical protein FKM82_010294 [Ascaphus truei]
MLCCFLVNFFLFGCYFYFCTRYVIFTWHQMCCPSISAHDPHNFYNSQSGVNTYTSLHKLLFLLQDADSTLQSDTSMHYKCTVLSNPMLSMYVTPL